MQAGRLIQLAFFALICMGSVNRVQAQETAKDHYLKGNKAFDLGLYDDAIKEYMAAYQLKDDVALIYNIAQAHRLAGHSAEALRFYKVYLIKEPQARNRTEVEQKIVELKKLVEQQKRTEAMPPESAIKPEPAGKPEPTNETPAVPATGSESSVSPAPTPTQDQTGAQPQSELLNSGRTMKFAGVGLAAGGLALVGVGIGFAVMANQNIDALNNINMMKGVFDPSKESAAGLDRTLEGVFLGVGGAAVAVGATLAILGWRKGRQQPQQISFIPAVSPRSASANLVVQF
jgi:hypothetical protein